MSTQWSARAAFPAQCHPLPPRPCPPPRPRLSALPPAPPPAPDPQGGQGLVTHTQDAGAPAPKPPSSERTGLSGHTWTGWCTQSPGGLRVRGPTPQPSGELHLESQAASCCPRLLSMRPLSPPKLEGEEAAEAASIFRWDGRGEEGPRGRGTAADNLRGMNRDSCWAIGPQSSASPSCLRAQGPPLPQPQRPAVGQGWPLTQSWPSPRERAHLKGAPSGTWDVKRP